MLGAGLKVKVDHMFGLPGEPVEAQEIARQLYAEYCPARVQTYWTSFLPGTEMMEQGIKAGLVTDEEAERLNEGKDFYFYRGVDNIKNPELVRRYQGYEFHFKIYPILPKGIRMNLKEPHIRWIPTKMKVAIGFISELLNAVQHTNPNVYVYGKFYAFHLYLFLRRKLGFKTTPKAVDAKKGVREMIEAVSGESATERKLAVS